MPARKTDPQPFPTRGTPSGYREIWDAEDSAVIEAQMAERERKMVAREVAAPHRRGKGRDAGETDIHQSASPTEASASDR